MAKLLQLSPLQLSLLQLNPHPPFDWYTAVPYVVGIRPEYGSYSTTFQQHCTSNSISLGGNSIAFFRSRRVHRKSTPNIPPNANFDLHKHFGLEVFTVLKFWAEHSAVHWAVHSAYFLEAHFAIELQPIDSFRQLPFSVTEFWAINFFLLWSSAYWPTGPVLFNYFSFSQFKKVVRPLCKSPFPDAPDLPDIIFIN